MRGRQHHRAMLAPVDPMRDGFVQDATFPGNDQKIALLRGSGTREEAIERAVRFFLSHAMEIEPRLDFHLAAFQAPGIAPVEAGIRFDRYPHYRSAPWLGLLPLAGEG